MSQNYNPQDEMLKKQGEAQQSRRDAQKTRWGSTGKYR